MSTIAPSENRWSKLYLLYRQLLRPKHVDHLLKDQSGQLHYNEGEKAEIFACAMKEQFKTPVGTTFNKLEDLVRDTLTAIKEQQHERSIFFTPTEIWNKIRKLPTKKAPGPDSITNSALKHSRRNVVVQLVHIYNGCLRAEYFSQSWKTATMIMIPKRGKNPKEPINFKPISLLNTMSKVLESLLLDRLKIWTKVRLEQHDFRAQHSTTTQLVNVINHLTNSTNLRRKTAAALLDIEKTFDKVWHNRVIYKLIQNKISHQLTNTVQSFLADRSF